MAITLSAILNRPLGLILGLIDRPMMAVQRRFGTVGMVYIFLLPNLIIFGLFSFTPALLNIWLSFTGGSSPLISERPFIGLSNYADIFACDSYLQPQTCKVAGFGFWTSLWNTLVFALIQVPVMTLVALATALVLNRRIWGRGFWRAMYFYPVMLSPVVVSIIWDWILKRRGILNQLLTDSIKWSNKVAEQPDAMWFVKIGVLFFLALGALYLVRFSRWAKIIGGIGLAAVAVWIVAVWDPAATFHIGPWRPINWLVDRDSVWPTFWVVFVYSWAHLGFYMLILLAGLQAIPRDIYEAATMDGTSPWRILYRITLPLLMPTLLVVLVLSLIKAFQVFDEVYILTGGGPGDATRFVIQHIYESAFTGETKLYGIAAAYSVLLAFVIFVLTAMQIFLTRRQAGGVS
ncbi:MAG: sugar ABC transporter permease [Alphaproteobacteria bacterium]